METSHILSHITIQHCLVSSSQPADTDRSGEGWGNIVLLSSETEELIKGANHEDSQLSQLYVYKNQHLHSAQAHLSMYYTSATLRIII